MSPESKAPKLRLASPWSARGLGTKSRERGKLRRPTISGPTGPVKNSRGADFTRSETLTIVDAIDDCTLDVTAETAQGAKTRKLPTSFNKGDPLMAKPTVARSAVTATTATQNPPEKEPTSHTRKPSLAMSASRPYVRMSSTASLLPRLDTTTASSASVTLQDENVPPPSNGRGPSPPPPRSKLPKSRTMNVLHDLRASLSRPSLTARSVNSTSLAGAPERPKTPPAPSPGSSSVTASSAATGTVVPPSASSKLRLPSQSQPSRARPTRSPTPEPDPALVTAAQPSAYWSGRFIAVYDRLSAEALACHSPPPPPKASGPPPPAYTSTSSTPQGPPQPYRPSKLSHSTTTSALPTTTTPNASSSSNTRPDDPLTRARRVFCHLDALCATPDARRSLRDWQRAYARRAGHPALLPDDDGAPGGGCGQDRGGLVARLFGGGGEGRDRRLSSLRGGPKGSGVPVAVGAKRFGLH